MKVLGKQEGQGLVCSRLARCWHTTCYFFPRWYSLFSSSCLAVLRFSWFLPPFLSFLLSFLPLFERRAIYTNASHNPSEPTPSTRISSRPERHRTTILVPRNLFEQNRHRLSSNSPDVCSTANNGKRGMKKPKGMNPHETKRDCTSYIMNNEIVGRIDSPWFPSRL